MRFVTCSVVAFVVVAFSMPVVAQASEVSAPNRELQTFAAELDSLRKAHHIPGLAAAVVRDQTLIWSEGYGMAYLDDEVM